MADQQLPVNQVRLDGGTQARTGTNPDVVQEYAVAMLDGARFPAIVVFHDGTAYWCADGFHRVLAAQRARQKRIRADVQPGSRRDAILYAVGANGTHGWPRTAADRRRAATILLSDAEWSQWANAEIGRRCGLSDKTIAGIRAQLQPALIPGISGDSPRTVRRSETTYPMRPPPGPRPAAAADSGREQLTISLSRPTYAMMVSLLPAYGSPDELFEAAIRSLSRGRAA